MDDAECSQPTASLGERLARLEAVFEARHEKDVTAAELFDEKIEGLRKELGATNSAQKEAVDKAEKAAARQFETFVEQNDRKADVTQGRLFAVEKAVSDLASAIGSATQVRTAYKASTLAWAGVLATILGGSVVALIINAVTGG